MKSRFITPRRMLAATLVAIIASSATFTPALAAPEDEAVGHSSRSFRHHFYRGQPYGTWAEDRRDGGYSAPLAGRLIPGLPLDVASSAPGIQQEAEAYCADRFRSYDPASGTYLGYDGREHACP